MVTSLRVGIGFQFQSYSGAVESWPARWSEVHRPQTWGPQTGAAGTVLIQGFATVPTASMKRRWAFSGVPSTATTLQPGAKRGSIALNHLFFLLNFRTTNRAKYNGNKHTLINRPGVAGAVLQTPP